MSVAPAARPASAPPRRPRLRRHLWNWVLGVLLLVWSSLIAAAWYTGHHEAAEVTDGQLIAMARLWLSARPAVDAPTEVTLPPGRVRRYVQDLAVLHWLGPRLVGDTHGLAPHLDPGRLPTQGLATVRIDGPSAQAWRVFVAEHPGVDGLHRVAVLMDMRHRIDLGRDMALHLARPALLVLPLVSLLLWAAIRRGLQPLERLSHELAGLDVMAGARLASDHRFREFASTEAAINALVDSLQAQARRERDFASDVAHELRTPLTALALQARAAQRDPSHARLASIEQEALRAGHILAQLLDLARAQRDSAALGEAAGVEWVDLGALSSELVAAHAPAADVQGQELALVCPPSPVRRRVPRLMLALALRNLIENALRHTPAGTHIEVYVWQGDGAMGVRVRDDAPPNPPATPPGDDGPPPPPKPDRLPGAGLGLGLRLVARLAEAMGAEMEQGNDEPPFSSSYGLRWSEPGDPPT